MIEALGTNIPRYFRYLPTATIPSIPTVYCTPISLTVRLLRIKPDIIMKCALRILQQGSGSIERGTSLLGSYAFSTSRLAAQTFHGRRYTSIAASKLQFGQPVYETHPHLLNVGEGKVEHMSPICWSLYLHSLSNSHSWNCSSRICLSSVESCLEAPEKFHCDCSCFRNQISIGCRIL